MFSVIELGYLMMGGANESMHSYSKNEVQTVQYVAGRRCLECRACLLRCFVPLHLRPSRTLVTSTGLYHQSYKTKR
jgi:hypothetical protein